MREFCKYTFRNQFNLIIISVFIFFLILLSSHNTALAGTGINSQIPYSGNIVRNDGTVLNGTYKAKFILYNVSSGGTSVYEEVRDGATTYGGVVSPGLSITDGRFEILLGSQNTTISNLNDDTLWLELQLDVDNNGSYEEIFSPRKRIGSAASAINAMRLVAIGGTDTDTLSLDLSGNVVATSLGGTANGSTPVGFDRVLLANSSGQFSQVSLSSIVSNDNLTTSTGWALAGNSTTNAWNGASGSRLGTTSAQPLILATTNATAQDIRFFTGANGANERMRITGAGNIGIGRTNPLQRVENAGAYLTFGQTTANQISAGAFDYNVANNETRILSWGPSGIAGNITFWTGQGNSGTLERLRITGSGDLLVPSLGGTLNSSAPVGYDRVLLANSSGQFSQVSTSALLTTPGGSDNQLQYKNGSVFAGATNVEINQGALRLLSQSTPTNPVSGSLFYSERLAGRDMPYYLSESGRAKAVGQAWYDAQSPVIVNISNTTSAPSVLGATIVTANINSYQFSPASTNRYLVLPRKRYSTTTGSATIGVRQDYTQFYSGNAAGYGGVFFSTRFGVNTNKLSSVFVGITASTVALAGNASALVNSIGMGYDVTDAITGNWFLMTNDGTGTAAKVDLGATNAARAVDTGYELNLYNPPNSTTWFVNIVNINTGAVVLNTSYSSDVPAVNTGLTWKLEARNDANETAVTLEHNYIYVEPQGW